MEKLFKNAKLVVLENETVLDVDILVENGKIKSFDKVKNFVGETIDLQGKFVMPSFVNGFYDSESAVISNYFSGQNCFSGKDIKKDACNLMLTKNLLAGAVFLNDITKTGVPVIQNIEEKDESELSALSNKIAQDKKTAFLKFGQDLLSLGTIDKEFGKSACSVLEDFGFLDRESIVVGGNCLEKDELEILSNYGCKFVILPNEDARVGRRATNVLSLLAKGFDICLGSGNSAEIDFFAFMRQVLSSTRTLFEDENCLTEKDVLSFATNGFVFGIDNRLKVGGRATFIVVDKTQSLYDEPFKTLVWECSKRDVCLCVKDGEVLQKNGEILMKNLPDYDTIIRNLKH